MSFKQIPFDFGFDSSWEADDFLLSDCNHEAVKRISAWPNWQGNGLYVYGPKGCGKTHLAEVWRRKSGATLWDNEQAGQAIVVDGLANIDEEALFHQFNRLKESGGYMLVLEQAPAREVGLKVKDLLSRLMTLPSVEMLPPDDTLLSAILIKQFHDRQLKVEPEVITYLLPRLERSGEAVMKVVEKLDREALALKKSITIPLIRQVLDELHPLP